MNIAIISSLFMIIISVWGIGSYFTRVQTAVRSQELKTDGLRRRIEDKKERMTLKKEHLQKTVTGLEKQLSELKKQLQ